MPASPDILALVRALARAVLVVCASASLQAHAGPSGSGRLAVPPVGAFASVLGFNEDGTRALVVEIATVAGTSQSVSYLVVGESGVEHEALLSASARLADGRVAEAVPRDLCRERARALEAQLADFRSVRVRLSGCARLERGTAVVDALRSTPQPLPLSTKLEALHQQLGTSGQTFVSDDGPLVVVIQVDPNDRFGVKPLIKTFLRSDPRLRDRWPAP